MSDQIAELQRRLGADSSNSSRPPSTDPPWDMTRAKKRSSRTRSGRNPGKQPGAEGSSRSLVDDPDRVVVLSPARCGGCAGSLADATESGRERRQRHTQIDVPTGWELAGRSPRRQVLGPPHG